MHHFQHLHSAHQGTDKDQMQTLSRATPLQSHTFPTSPCFISAHHLWLEVRKRCKMWHFNKHPIHSSFTFNKLKSCLLMDIQGREGFYLSLVRPGVMSHPTPLRHRHIRNCVPNQIKTDLHANT